MNIEKVSEKDLDVIKELARRSIIESVDANDSIKNEIITDTMIRIERNIYKSDCVFLKCSNEKVLGFILIQEYWNLSDLFLIPEAHGKGIGKFLLNAAISACLPRQEKGHIRVNASLNAEGFYRRLGFVTFNPENEVPNFVVPLIYNF